MTTDSTPGYERALAAEPRLQAIVTTVDALIELVRPGDTMCHGCVWDGIVKPLTSPLLGWERGYPTAVAKDPGSTKEFTGFGELMTETEEAEKHRAPATTDTEAWLRTSDAWDDFTRVLLNRLTAADRGAGHGICRGRKKETK